MFSSRVDVYIHFPLVPGDNTDFMEFNKWEESFKLFNIALTVYAQGTRLQTDLREYCESDKIQLYTPNDLMRHITPCT